MPLKILSLLLFCFLFSFNSHAQNAFGSSGRQDLEAFSITLQGGVAEPADRLKDYIDSDGAFRARLFGAFELSGRNWRVPIHFDLDLSKSSHAKINSSGAEFKYDRYTWSFLCALFSFGPYFQIVPSIGLIGVDIKDSDPNVNIDEFSLRPAGIITLDFSIPLLSFLELALSVRADWPLADKELDTSGNQVDVQDSMYSGFAGLKFIF